MEKPVSDRGNVPPILRQLRASMLEYVQQLFMKYRESASHLLLFMLSGESRNMKPNAVLVSALPFKGITDAKVGSLGDELIVKVHERGLMWQ